MPGRRINGVPKGEVKFTTIRSVKMLPKGQNVSKLPQGHMGCNGGRFVCPGVVGGTINVLRIIMGIDKG